MSTLQQTTASHHEYKRALQNLQSERLRRDHSDLAAEQQYQKIAYFFFDEIYGPRDFSKRDQQAQRLSQFLPLAPGLAARDIEQVLRLLELTNQLDEAVVLKLMEGEQPVDFDEAMYERAYREVDAYDERVVQIELVRNVLYNVERLARKKILGMALHRTSGLAQTVGMAELHAFLRRGHDAMQPVRDIHHFVSTIYVRERDRLDRIYGV
jgi:hypothetical protein